MKGKTGTGIREGTVRYALIGVMLSLGTSVASAGDLEPPDSAGGRGHFGAPVVTVTLAGDAGAVMIGGCGGWNIGPSLVLGFSAHGTTTEIDAPDGAMPDSMGPIDIEFQSFGFDLEYGLNPRAPTHLTLGALLGGAAVHYVPERTGEQHGETDFLLLLQPAVGVERRVNAWLHLNLALSYRLVSGAEQPGLRNSDINGPALGLAFKLGRF